MLKHQGFNLVELVTTMVIMSALAVIALPSLQAIQLQVRSESNIKAIQHTVTLARNIAINYNIPVTVCPIVENQCSTDWQLGLAVFTDSGKKFQLEGNDKIIHIMNPFHDEDIVQYNRKAIRFQPDGLASGTNGTLIYCPKEHTSPYSKAIIINQAGRARFSTKKSISCKK
ncbi:prepilin-type N-terminal cleavage/methylation domain-containing protein [Shewanella aestuarii]|uniref:Type II secretion system protein H n=1 Tax=Shewanella aestuarii TaxID=1028752 RepID=A0A6G9QNP6_9GAMM|nr:prepilin-type N-terminal cleavage/methylation domain-containing protein [Shewanella aestuarii]